MGTEILNLRRDLAFHDLKRGRVSLLRVSKEMRDKDLGQIIHSQIEMEVHACTYKYIYICNIMEICIYICCYSRKDTQGWWSILMVQVSCDGMFV